MPFDGNRAAALNSRAIIIIVITTTTATTIVAAANAATRPIVFKPTRPLPTPARLSATASTALRKYLKDSECGTVSTQRKLLGRLLWRAPSNFDLYLANPRLSLLNVGMWRRQGYLPYTQRLTRPLNGLMIIASMLIAYTNVETRCPYVRMVLRQHTPLKLERFLLHHQSILVPPNFAVYYGKIAHCEA
jgi:hypothetical protein